MLRQALAPLWAILFCTIAEPADEMYILVEFRDGLYKRQMYMCTSNSVASNFEMCLVISQTGSIILMRW